MTRTLIFLLLVGSLVGCTRRSLAPSPDMSNVQFASPSPEEGALPGIPITNEDMIKKVVEEQLGTKNLEVTISADAGMFAAGKVTNKDTNRELQWYAVKEKGGWQIISITEDIPRCSELANYPDFPTTLLPECLTNQDTVINR